jgi:hypothetical protein
LGHTVRVYGDQAAASGEITMSDLSKAQPMPIRVETSMGALSLFPQRFEDIGAFSKLPVNEPSSARLRLYLPYIAARSDALTENGDWPRIDEASSQQLPDEDVERIAEAYLSMPERRQVAEGAGPLSSPIVRGDGESATAYLDRMLKADHERQMADLDRTYESLCNRDQQSFSSALADVDRQASSLRDVATRIVQDLAGQEHRSELGPNAIPNSLEANRALLSSDAEIRQNERLKQMRDEEIALTRSICIVTTQSALLVASLSETATRFIRQVSETTEKSEAATRRSLRIVLVTVLIMGAFAVIAASAAIVSYLEERENRQMRNQWQESVLQSMKETAAAQEVQIKSVNDKIRELSDRQNALAAAPPPAPATDGAAQQATSEAAPEIQRSPKASSPKRGSKRKPSR